MNKAILTLGLIFILSLCASAFAAITDGFAGTVTGGDGGTAVTVTTAAQLKSYAASSSKYIITISGTIDCGSGGKIPCLANKTFKGANSSAKIIGNLQVGTNTIVQNLTVTNTGGDGVSMWGVKHVIVTNCTIYDCGDGCSDITQLSDYITIRWCKFYYTGTQAHRFVAIAGNVSGCNYNQTWHHNWFAQNCDQRMPSGSYCRVHLYNNYFETPGNYYASNFRVGAQALVQNNYYKSVKNPLSKQDGGKIKASGNTFSSCTGDMMATNDTLSWSPSYSYSLTATSSVPTTVKNGAGNR